MSEYPDLIIRKGNIDDLAAVQHCISEAYIGYVPRIGKRPASMDTNFEPLLRDGHVWVIEDKGDVIGLMVLIELVDHAELRSLAILPTRQKKGFGRKMISHAEKMARQNGYSTLHLYTNALLPELVSYYIDVGFVEAKREFDHGFDRVFMVKELK